MTEKFKIFAEFVKDLSSETKDLETYLHVKEYLKNYNLNIEISSKPLKNRFIEVNTKLTYVDNNESKNKSLSLNRIKPLRPESITSRIAIIFMSYCFPATRSTLLS